MTELKRFYQYIQEYYGDKVLNNYLEIVEQLTRNSKLIFLSTRTYERYCNKNNLLSTIKAIGYDYTKNLVNKQSLISYIQNQLKTNHESFYLKTKLPIEVLWQLEHNTEIFVEDILQDLTTYRIFTYYYKEFFTLLASVLLSSMKELELKNLLLFRKNTLINYIYNHYTTEKNYYVLGELARCISEISFTLKELQGTKLILLDTEMSDTKTAAPIQVAMLKCDISLRPIKALQYYIHQDNIEPSTIHIHGITKEVLAAHHPLDIYSALEKFNTFVSPNDIIIAHNYSSDKRAINFLFESNDMEMPNYDSYCTNKHYKDLKQSNIPNIPNHKQSTLLDFSQDKSKLSVIIDLFNFNNPDEAKDHNAAYDVSALYTILYNNKELFLYR